EVDLILIDGTGEKAFCAGGDVQDLYWEAKKGNFEAGRKFWRDEYPLNARIARYPKPYVALMDGIDMGGGVGVSVHGSHRIVTERTMVALPECAIGLIPDVGSSFVLARAPGHLGEFVGLTGYRLNAADAIFCGVADSFVSVAKVDALVEALCNSGDPDKIGAFATAPDTAPLAPLQAEIDAVFGLPDLLAIAAALAGVETEWAHKAMAGLRRGSPLSLGSALHTIRAARQVETLEDALALEFRFTYRSHSDADFTEGTRALIIDKDKSPVWSVPNIEALKQSQIDALVAPLGEHELVISH
ncbi:MAG: enoyl-CoA hydratase/isomerase family protein, partial [Pseudomonadota bacterium]